MNVLLIYPNVSKYVLIHGMGTTAPVIQVTELIQLIHTVVMVSVLNITDLAMFFS